MGLGPCESVSLAEAREQAAVIRAKIRQGIDPIQERQAKEEEERGKNVTFGDCAQDYIKSHQASWKNAKHASQWQNTLATYALPVIGDLHPKEVTTEHLLKILQPIWPTKTETANRVRNRIELILDAAAAKSLRPSDNPARWRGHLDKLLARPSKIAKVRHHPALAYERIPELFSTLAGHQDISAMALQLLILTASRASEVVGAHWAEFEANNGLWIIPSQRMKASNGHRIPLSQPALELLKRIPRIDNSPYLFPGQRKNNTLTTGAMLMKLRGLDEIATSQDQTGWKDPQGNVITTHGLRSSFRDWAADLGNFSREAVEIALAHKVAQGAEAAYWRSDLLEKRRALMEAWGDFCLGKSSGHA